MSELRRLVLVRHGESNGRSSERMIGSGDPELSPEGREQMRAARAALSGQVLDCVASSPKRRAWQSAAVLVGEAPIQIEPDFREIHFGRWEGLTPAEIEAADPVLYAEWRSGSESFEFPGGELRADFRARVERGLERLLASGVTGALVVAHKGVVRAIQQRLTGEKPEPDRPGLGEAGLLTRSEGGDWFVGQRSSNPPSLEA